MSGDDDLREQKTDLLSRLSAIETVVAALIALIVLAGLMLVGKGFYMKARSEASHVQHRSFAMQSGRSAAEFQTAANVSETRQGAAIVAAAID
jgi:Tfp pilus assembly protein PilW